MPRRTQLKGVAANLAQFCTSRNFDYDGYWAMGVLYSHAQKSDANEITLDLCKRIMEPNHDSAAVIAKPLIEVLNKCIHNNSLPEGWVSECKVLFAFNVEFKQKYHYWGSALGGDPYLCTASIRTDLGRAMHFTTGGNVWVHNPCKESRRYGF